MTRIGPAVRRVWFVLPLLVVVAGLVWLLQPLRVASKLPAPPLPSYTPEPPDFQEMLVLGPTAFAPETPGAIRVVIRDPRSGQPLPGAEVRLSLAPANEITPEAVLFQGETNDLGTLDASFEIPALEEGEWTMVIDAIGPVGDQHIERRITIQRPLALSVQTHQRTYRPGQRVYVWMWAGGRVDRRPASDELVTWALLDPRGNSVCRGIARTSEYGVVQEQCNLADGAGEGRYRVVATLGETTVESELQVEDRPVPSLRVKVRPALGYFFPERSLQSEVQVTDLRGVPIANAIVEVEGRLVTEGTLLFRRSGRTDDTGSYATEAAAQDLLVPDLASADSVQLVAWATDPTGRSGRGESVVPVSRQGIVMTAWPESAVLKPGIENRIRLRTETPGGHAVSCALEATISGVGEAIQVETDEAGLAWIPVVPEPGSRVRIALRAKDAAGSEGSARLDLPVAEGTRHLLLRPEAASYACGETMSARAWTVEGATTLYLDLRIAGQLVATYSAAVEKGQAQFDVPLPGEWAGPVELDAYTLLADGTLLRDIHEVTVACSPQLQVRVREAADQPDASGPAQIVVEANGVDGTVAPVLVSASVAEPGAERAEVVIPRVEHLVPAPDLAPQYAETASKFRPISAEVLQAFESYRDAWAARATAFAHAAERLSWGAVTLGCLSWAIALPSIWRRRHSPVPSLISGLAVGPLLILGGVLSTYAGSLSMGPGAILAFGLAWLGVVTVTLAQAASGTGPGWLAPLSMGAVAGGALAVGLRYATRHAMGTVPHLVLRGWAGLGAVCLALSAYALDHVRDGKPRFALTTFSLVFLLAATWGGSLLVDWGPNGPVYRELPPLRPPVDPPAHMPIDDQAMFFTTGRELSSAPLPAVGDGGTLHWVPGAEVESQDSTLLEVPLLRTANGVHVRAFAMDAQGRWGRADTLLDLAQPVWATVELPSELTVGDQLDVPVNVRNTLPVSSSVQISVTNREWFTLRSASAGLQEASIAARGEHTFVLPLRVEAWGEQTLELSLQSANWRETITRTASVQPNGKWVSGAYSWWVEEETGYKFRIPWAAYEDSDRIAVRIYAGPQSVLSDALLHASQQTTGSFDELLAGVEARMVWLSQLASTGDASAPLRAELGRDLETDGQRLLAFQAADGGFGPVPGSAPDLYRSAAAVRCLGELAARSAVAPDVVERAAAWLLAQQGVDGTWQLEDPPPSWVTLPHAELPVTAYVTWALLDAGYGKNSGVQAGVQHLMQHVENVQDPYVLGLVANAFLSTGIELDDILPSLDRLAEQAEVRYGIARWHSGLQTLSGSAGSEIEAGGYRTPSVKVEVTALATLALARGGRHPEVVEAGMAMLIDSRDVQGTWNAPSPTAWAIRALRAGLSDLSADASGRLASARVSVGMNGGQARALGVQGDVSAEAVFEELEKGYNDIQITVDGDRMAYQIAGSYYLRWSQVPPPLSSEEELSLEISYDRTALRVGEMITSTVIVMLNRPGTAPLTRVELGVPPGLNLIEADLERLLTSGAIARHERVGSRLRLYLAGLSSEEPVQLAYRLQGTYPVRVLTPPSYGVDIANPQRPAVRAPVQVVVNRE